MYKKCQGCRGAKQVLGLGMIKRKCGECDGIGFTKEVVQLKGDECDDRKEEAKRRVRRKAKKEAKPEDTA